MIEARPLVFVCRAFKKRFGHVQCLEQEFEIAAVGAFDVYLAFRLPFGFLDISVFAAVIFSHSGTCCSQLLTPA